MRLHALELTGFGPFRQTQRVDFDAFGDDGVFLITGRTGAGKSSILDGVSFALYGTVPRYEGADKRLRSDHCFLTDPTEVRLEFTIGDTRWRVTRSPDYDRPAKRGGGLTTAPARAELEERVGDAWVGRAAKPRDVGIALGELLGLGAQQFQQVILLAQNKFSRFLLAPGDERQALLRALFGTRRFESYRDELEQRRRDAQKKLDGAAEHARTLLELAEQLADEQAAAHHDAGAERPTELAARRDALIAALGRADYRGEQARTEQQLAETAARAAAEAHAALAERFRRGRERTAARERLAELEAGAPRIETERRRLGRARAAEALRATIETAEAAAAAHASALRAEEAALADWTSRGGAAAVDPAERIEQLTADLARWTDAAVLEREHGGLCARRDDEAAALAQTEADLAALDAQLALVPAERETLDADVDRERAAAARSEDALRRCAELSARLDAARETAALADESAAADRAHLEASARAAGAAAAVTDLLQRRLAGFAGELASGLVDGDPCAVCGSTTHPLPAAPAADPVTDADLAAAERARDDTAAAAAAAADTARDVRGRVSDARARAGGHDVPGAEAALAAARADADVAAAANERLARLLTRRAELDELAAVADTERAAVAGRLTALREEHAATRAEAQRAEAAIAAARGAFTTVAARVADGEAERARARALADARTEVAERTRALDVATTDLEARCAASDFADGSEVRAALLPASEIAELDARLTAYAADLGATRARLLELELELAAFDGDVTDGEVAAAERALADADAQRTAAIAAVRDAELAARRLRELAQQADDAYAAVAEVADDAAAVTRLADTVAGRAPNTMKMDLETFVLAAELEEIVAAANVRLADMSSGRYTLHHSDARAARGRASGLGIEVLDAHTGRLRSPHSLSGGETFLASLALALGLGEVVTSRAGGIRLDTLFVDEGFGSLDPETLELAMRTLDELRAGGRVVGVISHVEAMKEQLPAQLVVEATPEGPSVIRQDARAPA